MELKFVAAKKPESGNVALQRRQRLVRRIDDQINLIQNAKDGFLPRTSWVWMDDKGAYLLAIKYGRNPIQFEKGMFAIQCESMEHAAATLGVVRTMVLNGDFDACLSQASADIRAKFSKA
jgi:hypothetical protein